MLPVNTCQYFDFNAQVSAMIYMIIHGQSILGMMVAEMMQKSKEVPTDFAEVFWANLIERNYKKNPFLIAHSIKMKSA